MASGIFTLLYDVSYLPGALLLGSILKDMIKDTEGSIKLGVLIDKTQFDSHQLQLLQGIYDDIIDTEVIESLLTLLLQQGINRPELGKTFTKINLWGMKHYEKIMYLDADTLPNPQSNLLQLLQLEWPDDKILASPDSGFPDIFNSGMFLLKPNDRDYKNLVDLVKNEGSVSFDGADQGLLNQYFNKDPDWVTKTVELKKGSSEGVSNISMMSFSNWIKLPFLYNVTPNSQYEYAPAYNYFSNDKLFPFGDNSSLPSTTTSSVPTTSLNPEDAGAGGETYGYTAAKHFKSQVKLVHFIGPYKPWNYPYTSNHLEWWGLWYKYFDKGILDLIHNKPKPAASTMTITSPPPKAKKQVHAHFAEPRKPTSKKKSSYLAKATEKTLQNREKESIFGYHPFQRPERSFNESEDYVPTHPMISKSKPAKEESGYSRAVNVDKVTEQLEKLNRE